MPISESVIRVANRVNQLYRYLILASIVVGALFPQLGASLKAFVPYLIALMIASLTLASSREDFLSVLKEPQNVLLGLTLIFVLSPSLSYLISLGFLKPHGEVATGLILVASTPSGWAVGAWTGLAGGEVVLGLALSILSTALAAFLIPFLVASLAGAYVRLDAFGMLRELALIVILPMLLMTAIKSRVANRKTEECKPLFLAVSSVAMLVLGATMGALVMPILLSKEAEPMLPSLIAAVGVQCILSFSLGYAVSKLVFKRDLRRSIALTYATGSRNNSLAMAIALGYLPLIAAAPSVIYLVMQILVSSVLIHFFERRQKTTRER